MQLIDTSKELALVLKSSGYIVTKHSCCDGVYYTIRGNGVFGYINDFYFQKGIFIDNSKCFDKASRCPIRMKFPVNFEKLLSEMKYVTTPEGYKESKTYAYTEDGYNKMTIEF